MLEEANISVGMLFYLLFMFLSVVGNSYNESLLVETLRLRGARISKYFCDGRNELASVYFAELKKYYNKTGIVLTPGEYGCARSHMSALKDICEAQISALVIEEDAFLRPWIKLPSVDAVLRWISPEDVIILGCQDGLWTESLLIDNYMLRLVAGSHIYRTAAYAIGCQAARCIYEQQRDLLHRADDWKDFSSVIPGSIYYLNLFGHPMIPNLSMEDERRGFSVHMSLADRILAKVKQNIFPFTGNTKKLIAHRVISYDSLLVNYEPTGTHDKR